jgi:hypothetical protein
VVKRLVLIALAGCATFEDPNIVIDIRALAMHATVPEQIVDIDLNNPPQPEELLQQLVPSTVCMLVADPTNMRRLRWTMTLCPYGDGERCDDDHPQTVIGQGIADDPETSNFDVAPKTCADQADARQSDPTVVVPDGCACATVNPDGNLLGVLLDALDNDPLKGFQGLDYEVMLRVGGEGGDPDLDQYAAKGLRIAARIPSTRTANNNPSMRQLQGQFEGNDPFLLELGRCADNPLPMHEIPPNTKINLFPVESGGARETYVLPTLDGGSEMFTEALTYQWVASGGGLSRGDTGGPHDAFGNDAPLDTDWTSPPADKLDGPTDFTIWIVQRDERLGVSWYETCMRVVP